MRRRELVRLDEARLHLRRDVAVVGARRRGRSAARPTSSLWTARTRSVRARDLRRRRPRSPRRAPRRSAARCRCSSSTLTCDAVAVARRRAWSRPWSRSSCRRPARRPSGGRSRPARRRRPRRRRRAARSPTASGDGGSDAASARAGRCGGSRVMPRLRAACRRSRRTGSGSSSRCTSWMRAVRVCGTHRWTSPSRQEFADAAAALAGQRDDAHLALVRGLDRRDHVGRVARGRDREQHVAAGARARAPASRRPARTRSRWRPRSGATCRWSARSPAARVARARSGRPARRRSAARRPPSRRCRRRGCLPSASRHSVIDVGGARDQRRHRAGRGELELGALGEVRADALDGSMARRFYQPPATRRSTSRSHSMRAASRPSSSTTSKRHGGVARQPREVARAPRRSGARAWPR